MHPVLSWRAVVLVLVLSGGPLGDSRAAVVDFEDLVLASESYWNGPDPNGTVVDRVMYEMPVQVNQGSFASGGVTFGNSYNLTWGSWSGFAYSNTSDTTNGYPNEFSAYTGSGRGSGADNYGVAFGYHNLEATWSAPAFDPSDVTHLQGLPSLTLPSGATIEGAYVTNTTFAALSVLAGDEFAKAFGGPSGNDPDWLKITAYGIDALGNVILTSNPVEFYLADYRYEDNDLDHVVTGWEYFDLSALTGARSIHFNISSTDASGNGMNTPSYFAIDDISYAVTNTTTPEPASLILWAGFGVVGFVAVRRRKLAA